MIARRRPRSADAGKAETHGFDAFDLRLGDLMRGERATLGKSLLDVERELRISASYVDAIENSDPSAFDTPGFIPGYVRSYARYLGMDPDKAFASFCAEAGFSIAHGMSANASSRAHADRRAASADASAARDPLSGPGTPFAPVRESVLSRIEPGAIASALVLVALIGAIGYGGWSVMRQVQQVRLAPLENTPAVLAELDPLASTAGSVNGAFEAPDEDRLARLYRPRALDVPVMVARDGPISTLDPRRMGTLSPASPDADRDSAIARALRAMQQDRTAPRIAIPPMRAAVPVEDGPGQDVPARDVPVQQAGDETRPPERPGTSPKVVADAPPTVRVVAVRPAWVRVRAADGSVLYQGILQAGDTYEVPATREAPRLRVGESGAVYFAVDGKHYGPAGPSGAVTANLALSADALIGRFEFADLQADADLQSVVAELSGAAQP